MFTVKSPLEYFPITVGDYRLTYDPKMNQYSLIEKNHAWMGYDKNSYWQSTEFFIEISCAKGICVTTGLGLGIIQTILSLKNDVTKVIVYEKSKDVIEIFHKIVEFNNFDISKIEIKNQDADHIKGETCDFLFPDHFDSEPEKDIIEVVKRLSYDNNAANVWYWPAGHHFIKFALRKDLPLNEETYNMWRIYTGIKNLIDPYYDNFFPYIDELKTIYLRDVIASPLHYDIARLEQKNIQKNNLLKLSKKLR